MSPRYCDLNKQKHYISECYSDTDEIYGEPLRKYHRTECESPLKKISKYDDTNKLHSKLYRFSRSRSTSKCPQKEKISDVLKGFWSKENRKMSKVKIGL